MKKMLALSGLALALVFCATPPPPEPAIDVAAVRSAIEAANMAFAEAFNSGNFEGLGSYYTEDAVALPPNGTTASGREAIVAAFAAFAPMNPSGFTLSTTTLDVPSAETAVELGAYALQLTLPGSEAPIEDRGKYIVVWKKEADGAWRLHWDIWNSDIPLPGMEPSEEAAQ